MSKMTRNYAKKVVKVWQTRLRLDHWDLDIEFHEDGDLPDDIFEGVGAWCTSGKDYFRATIGFGDGWMHWDKEALNLAVCHELMHVVTRDWARATQIMNEQGWIGKDAWHAIDTRLDHEQEQMVEHMAQVLVRLGGVV